MQKMSTKKKGRDPPVKLTSSCGVWAIPKNTACKFFTKYLFVCNLGHTGLLPDSIDLPLCSSMHKKCSEGT